MGSEIKSFGSGLESGSNELKSRVLGVGWVGSRQYIAEVKNFQFFLNSYQFYTFCDRVNPVWRCTSCRTKGPCVQARCR